MNLLKRSKKSFTATVLLCLLRCICQTTVSMAAEYCPYHLKTNQHPQKKLSQEEVRQEVMALQDMGLKRLAIEAGEDAGK